MDTTKTVKIPNTYNKPVKKITEITSLVSSYFPK